MKKLFVILDDFLPLRRELKQELKILYPECEIFETDSLLQINDTVEDEVFLTAITCVFLDGENPDGQDYPSFAVSLRSKGYKGPIIAMSLNTELRKTMLSNGCTQEVANKYEVTTWLPVICTQLGL